MVRFKNRWLLLSIEFPAGPNSQTNPSHSSSSSSSSASPSAALTISPQALLSSIRSSLLTFFGQSAAGALGGPLSVKYASSRSRLAIVRCSRVGAEVIRAAITLVCDIETTAAGGAPRGTTLVPTRISIVGVSGTIKKLQLQAIRIDRRIIQEEQARSKRRSKDRKRRAVGKGVGNTLDGSRSGNVKTDIATPNQSLKSIVAESSDTAVPGGSVEPSTVPSSGSGLLGGLGYTEEEEDLGAAIQPSLDIVRPPNGPR